MSHPIVTHYVWHTSCADIPNEAGFRLVTDCGRECVVVRAPDTGLHYLADANTGEHVTLKTVSSWRKI